jgi:hypothetical protein
MRLYNNVNAGKKALYIRGATPGVAASDKPSEYADCSGQAGITMRHLKSDRP